MAEGFEPYHVPQQSRRDKLRVVAQNHPLDLQSLLPLCDPSLLSSSSDLHQNSAKEGANSNLMAFSSSYNPYLDPQPSNLPNLNPSSSIHDINSNFFLYTQNLKAFDSPFNGGSETGVVIPFKPEPLSLSLSSQSQCNLPLELNLQRYGSAVTAASGGGYAVSGQNGVSTSPVPLGPFTGYASILKGSRFFKPAQLLLEEFCDVGRVVCIEKTAMDASFFDPSVDCFSSDDPADSTENRRNKSRLISMLDEVYRRYKYYYQQMQAVMASFECVPGLGNAAPYANLALKTLSKHFKSLKNAITDQLQYTAKGPTKGEVMRFGNYEKALCVKRPVHSSGFVDHQPVWRPQRGLPERAVTVLKAWLFEHFLHPYPNDTDKLMLAKQTGLSRSQVSNWFINARVRLWKPMVEEIHMLETRQAQQKGSVRQEPNANKSSSNPIPTSNPENPSASTQIVHEIPSKRTRSDLPNLPSPNEYLPNLPYNGMTSHPPIVRSSGVSLTLGLHQNNGTGVSDPFQRFGLGLETSDGVVMGGFEPQDQQYGRDVMGGQIMHDFVG